MDYLSLSDQYIKRLTLLHKKRIKINKIENKNTTQNYNFQRNFKKQFQYQGKKSAKFKEVLIPTYHRVKQGRHTYECNHDQDNKPFHHHTLVHL